MKKQSEIQISLDKNKKWFQKSNSGRNVNKRYMNGQVEPLQRVFRLPVSTTIKVRAGVKPPKKLENEPL